MSESKNPVGDPGFSTLEIDHRSPFSTLEVDYRGAFSTLEVKPGEGIEPLNSVSTSQKKPGELLQQRPWWKRYWLVIVVVGILVSGGIIGSVVGGTLASKSEPNEKGDSEEAVSTLSYKPTNTTPTTVGQSTTISYPTFKPTATPRRGAVTVDPIWIGTREEDGEGLHAAFALDGTESAPCYYAIIPVPDPENPCSHTFMLPNGFKYSWEGCGGGTWVEWMNPSNKNQTYRKLHKGLCEYKPTAFECDDIVIKASWLCGNNTIG